MRGFFRAVGRAFTFARTATANIIFLIFIVIVLSILFAPSDAVRVPDSAALVLEPSGVIVEKASVRDPISLLTGPSALPETALGDVLTAIERATDDDRIDTIVLKLDQLAGINSTQVTAIESALKSFRAQDKQVLAYGSFFGQQQYQLASAADAVYLHPMGAVLLEGYGIYQPYIKGLLDRLKVNVNVFRVGTYKAAVEPFTRDDMSAAARQNFSELIAGLWQQALQRISGNRSLTTEAVNAYAQNFPGLINAAGGDMARAAIEARLADELMTPDQFNRRVAERVGVSSEDGAGFEGITMTEYLSATNRPELPSNNDKVAVITATGTIMGGVDGPGLMGADSVIELIRQVRDDDSIKSLVVRIDSPGGSVLASELIRQEIELVQLAGTPVVASYAGTSASGGYWISATSDHIVAAPSSVTGSIGIFSIVPTLNESASSIGIETDGVGTTPLSGSQSLLSPMTEEFASVLQSSVEHGYQRFLNLVARGRDMTPEAVDEIAQGRVWLGERALELGLVDSLGDLEDAIEVAAEIAELGDDYDVLHVKRKLTPQEQLLAQLADQMGSVSLAPSLLGRAGTAVSVARYKADAEDALATLLMATERPTNMALCEACRVTSNGR
ncbi:MAG: signal peptide peptidase SppA [Pseudomonadaceae bacterium]|nr:signal peptide peptidase SppA [Pseudomonadaceae bacterium]